MQWPDRLLWRVVAYGGRLPARLQGQFRQRRAGAWQALALAELAEALVTEVKPVSPGGTLKVRTGQRCVQG